jgi:Protein of unknown function (DUF2934)
MATRQRSRAPRKSTSAPTIPGSTATEISTEQRTQDSEVLHASFDPTPFETPGANASDDADIPKVTFVGERLVYRDRTALIAQAAYLRAEQRGFWPGNELDDWLAAEKEVDAMLAPDGIRGAK